MFKKFLCYFTNEEAKEIKVDDCAICIGKIKNVNSCILKCGHKFHLDCILELHNHRKEFSNKCPLCRKEYIQQKDVVDENIITERRYIISELRNMLANFVDNLDDEMTDDEMTDDNEIILNHRLDDEMRQEYLAEILFED